MEKLRVELEFLELPAVWVISVFKYKGMSGILMNMQGQKQVYRRYYFVLGG